MSNGPMAISALPTTNTYTNSDLIIIVQNVAGTNTTLTITPAYLFSNLAYTNASGNIALTNSFSIGVMNATSNGFLVTNSSIQLGNTSVYNNSVPGSVLTTSNVITANVYANIVTANTITVNNNLNVSGNTLLQPTSIFSIGNSTVNTFSNSTHFFAGNSTVYGLSNSTVETLVSPACNTVMTSANVTIGNSTVYGFSNSTTDAMVTPTSNATLTASQFTLGNSTVYSFSNSTNEIVVGASGNATINSTAFVVGNSTVFSTVNTTASNVQVSYVGNSTVNAAVTANGYTMLPNGLKLNWGWVSANNTVGAVTFTSQFTTNAFSVTASSNTPVATYSAGVTAWTKTGATILTANGTSTNVFWSAIGQ